MVHTIAMKDTLYGGVPPWQEDGSVWASLSAGRVIAHIDAEAPGLARLDFVRNVGGHREVVIRVLNARSRLPGHNVV